MEFEENTQSKAQTVDFELIKVIPDYPKQLKTDQGRSEWDNVCQSLISVHRLQSVDLPLLTAYCKELEIYWMCMEKIDGEDGGLYGTTDRGGIKKSPNLMIATGALANAMRIAKWFKLDPLSRMAGAPIEPDKTGKALKDELIG